MKWLKTQNTHKGALADIYLFDAIDNWFGIGKSALVESIAQSGAQNLLLHISSPGGSVDDALAMHDYLKAFNGNVTARITGFALSAATLVALGAHEVEMSENALFMIHRITVSSEDAHAADLRRTAGVIESLEEQVIRIYHQKCASNGKDTSAELIRQMMEDETWMTASEALNYGFIDRIYYPNPQQINPQNNMKEFIQEFRAMMAGFRQKPESALEKPALEEHSLHISNLEQKATTLVAENAALKDKIARLEARGINQPAGNDPEPTSSLPKNPFWEAEAQALLQEMSPLERSFLQK